MAGDNEEISLADLIAVLWKHRLFILICTVGAFGLGLTYVLIATPRYTASIVVYPSAADEPDGGLARLAGSFGSAAALMGINLSGGQSSRAEHIAILKSAQLATRFARERGLVQHLFAERWDPAKDAWRSDEDEGPPTDWEIYERFRNISNMEEEAQSGLITFSIESEDPELAAKWANDFVAMANAVIRDATIAEASKSIEFLTAKVEETPIAELRVKLYELIEAQIEKVTLANARQEYAFRVIDSAMVPAKASRPRRVFICALALALGLSVSFIFVMFRDFYGESRVRTS